MKLVSPSILSADFADYRSALQMLEAGGADYIHCDVMDGMFVPNISFGMDTVAAFKRNTKVPLDVHLMIEQPERYIEAFAKAGADIITVHAEACKHLHRVVQQIKACGLKAGVALNPATPVNNLQYLTDTLDLILVMSVNPGFGGQKFIPSALQKLKEAKGLIHASGRDIILEIDGGVNMSNYRQVVSAGADMLVSGSGVFGHADPALAIAIMQGRVKSL